MKKKTTWLFIQKNIANFEAFLKSIKLDANFFIQFSYTKTLTWNLWVFFVFKS